MTTLSSATITGLADVMVAELVALMPRTMSLTLPVSTLRFIDEQCELRGIGRGEFLTAVIAENQ